MEVRNKDCSGIRSARGGREGVNRERLELEKSKGMMQVWDLPNMLRNVCRKSPTVL